LESMYEEFANICSLDQFLAVFREATKEKHDFLSIDLNAADESQRFRRNFDTALVVPESKPEISLKKRKTEDV